MDSSVHSYYRKYYGCIRSADDSTYKQTIKYIIMYSRESTVQIRINSDAFITFFAARCEEKGPCRNQRLMIPYVYRCKLIFYEKRLRNSMNVLKGRRIFDFNIL